VIRNDDRSTPAWNILNSLDFDPEVTAKELKPNAVQGLETAMFDKFN
jgi:hypothetical protein